MRVIDIINQAKGETLFSFEVLPPKKGENIQSLFDCIDPLMEFNPAFIDVTYSREQLFEKQMSDGSIKQVLTSKRPGTVGICAAIINRYKIPVVPHLICGGFTIDETENALIDLNYLGIENILAMQGDKMDSEPHFIPTEGGHAYASELINQIMDTNKGVYLDEDLGDLAATKFCVSAACYPEKHFAAKSMEEDIRYLKQKVDLGAEYLVTQMFFDNQKYFEFVDLCRANGISFPIIPGIKPLSTKRQLEVLPKIFYTAIPQELQDQVLACKDNKEVKEVGVAWAVKQSLELKAAGVPILHYYTMSRADSTIKIAEQVFG
jgi:methylenetetrahydrofolate reductase (NADPH)